MRSQSQEKVQQENPEENDEEQDKPTQSPQKPNSIHFHLSIPDFKARLQLVSAPLQVFDAYPKSDLAERNLNLAMISKEDYMLTAMARPKQYSRGCYEKLILMMYKNNKEIPNLENKEIKEYHDLTFIKTLKNYFFMSKSRLYQALSSKPPYDPDFKPVFDFRGTTRRYRNWEKRTFRYCHRSKRLVFLTKTRIVIFNFFLKRIERSYQHPLKTTIVDFLVFGELEDQALLLSSAGRLTYLKLIGDPMVHTVDIKGSYARRMKNYKMAVSDNHKIVCVVSKDKRLNNRCKSVALIFEVRPKQGLLKRRTECLIERQKSNEFSCLRFWRRFGDEYLFVGFSEDEEKDVFFVKFKSRFSLVVDLEQKRLSSGVCYPVKVQELDGELYIWSSCLRLVKLSIDDF